MQAADARPGDVLVDGQGEFWKRGGGATIWSTFDGPVTYEGPWLPEYGPQGELTLVFRAGGLV